jgi:hypothetical protein
MVPSALGEALRLVGQGAAVVPCHPGSKRAIVSVHAASTDPERIERWARQVPDANWGIAALESGLVFADLDRRTDYDGLANFAQLLSQFRHSWPTTRTTLSVTPGSRHLWFARPPGTVVGRTLAPGVAVIANGYVMAPGSTVAGRRYRLMTDAAPVELPGEITERCRPTPPTTDVADHARIGLEWVAVRTLERGARMVRQAKRPSDGHPGERNRTLFNAARWAGGLVAAGRLDERRAEITLTEAGLEAGLCLDEITTTVASGIRTGSIAPLR